MIRISTIFIAICMVLVAASLGLVLYSIAGISGTESAIVALTALTFLILYNAVSMRLRDRSDVRTFLLRAAANRLERACVSFVDLRLRHSAPAHAHTHCRADHVHADDLPGPARIAPARRRPGRGRRRLVHGPGQRRARLARSCDRRRSRDRARGRIGAARRDRRA